ncbi:MAG: transposase, partial [Armatimonadota bacterium]|nr:transposase [Armatimonadota bacterium]
NEGRTKGRMEGMAEGRVEAKRADLLRALQLRFEQVPSDLVTSINTQSNLDKLSTWFDAALTAASPEEFRAAVRR